EQLLQALYPHPQPRLVDHVPLSLNPDSRPPVTPAGTAPRPVPRRAAGPTPPRHDPGRGPRELTRGEPRRGQGTVPGTAPPGRGAPRRAGRRSNPASRPTPGRP